MTGLGGCPVVVAIGGNALVRRGERGTAEEQLAHVRECMLPVSRLIKSGRRVIVTHGNGPAVGNLLLQMECAREAVSPMPLYIADADSEGGIGLMVQQALYNFLHGSRDVGVVTVVTQVVVDPSDPAFTKPSKPVGPYMTHKEARLKEVTSGWVTKGDDINGYRRVVPSPMPLRIIEAATIKRLSGAGDVVIAAGGGGVPVIEDSEGLLFGVDAVIDKDAAACLLAREVGAGLLVILMEEAAVYTGYGTPDARPIGAISACDLKALLSAGEFAPGSVGPKVAAAVDFVVSGAGEAIITSPELLEAALAGIAGTRVTGT